MAPWCTHTPTPSLSSLPYEYHLQKGLNVYNTARKDSVTGEQVGSGQGSPALTALPSPGQNPDTGASKLRVGPTLLNWPILNQLTFGPYWVVDVGKKRT
jgi:hypothetical protein